MGMIFGTGLGMGWKRIVPAKIRNKFTRTSRQIMRNPAEYTSRGLQVPTASKVGQKIEEGLTFRPVNEFLTKARDLGQTAGEKIVESFTAAPKHPLNISTMK